jgi:histidinol phosphatase-like enzyme
MMSREVKIIFLDIDGVLVNRWSLQHHSGGRAIAHPDCVAALNRITDQTGAEFVITSTWRAAGLKQMESIFKKWGVTGKILDKTPDLSWRVGAVYAAKERGDEIQEWLDCSSIYPPVTSFVILDDDSDMKHLKDRLVRTSFPEGLTMQHAEQAIEMLQVCEMSPAP